METANTSLLPARQKLLAFAAQSGQRLWAAKAAGRPIGWASTKFPAELAAALGLETACPESMAAALAGKGQGGALCRAAGGLGYCEDLCSYTRIGLALAEGLGEEPRPRPDFLLCCTNICTNMLQWYQNMARQLQVPLFLLDVPYLAEGGPTPGLLDYLRGQFAQLSGELAHFAGVAWQQEAFEEVCAAANRTAASWQRLCALLEDPLCPWDGMELFDYMPLLVGSRCREETAPLLDALADELRALPRAPGPAKARLLLEGTPCWPHLQSMLAPLRRAGIAIAADVITPSLGLSYQGLDGLLKATCATINGSTLETGFVSRRALGHSRRIDGVLVHYNRSCRPWSGTLPELSRRLAEEGWAVAGFQGDQADPAAFNGSQYDTCIQGLGELLEQRAGGGRQV